MGTVYLAEDTHLGRRVAIKFPPSILTHDYRAAFCAKRAVSELNHPGIATLFDYGERTRAGLSRHGVCQGQPLTQLMHQGELSLSRA